MTSWDDVRIVGVAESDLGVTDCSILQLQTQAILRALDDCGLSLADVDGLATAGIPRFPAVQVAEYLGITPRWTDTTFAGGASFEIHIAHAAAAIAVGSAEVVVVAYGSNQRSAGSRRLGGVLDPHQPESQFDAPYRPLNPISFYAMAAQRHMHEFGTTPEQLAQVAVAARAWALLNPKAYRHDAGPATVEQVLASDMISSPLHTLDCCLVTDGGGAVVVTTAERARSLDVQAIRILGVGEATTHHGMSQVPDLVRTGAADSAGQAYEQAGLGPTDIDVAQIYDSFTITVLLELEGLGFCGVGESGPFVQAGALLPGSSLPINTSGGGLSYCHPGMLGILLVVEAVRQLRGQAGARQVPGARIAVAHGTGGILSTHATLLLAA